VALVGNGQSQSSKCTKTIQGFCRQVLTWGDVWIRKWSVVEHQKKSVTKRFESQVFKPIGRPIQSVGKKFSLHLQAGITRKP
jgi:hypothetical protein